MELIPHLYEGINFSTIPKCILDELKTHSDIRSFISTRNENGEMKTKEGDFTPPLFMLVNDLNFYVNSKYIFHLFKFLDLGICFDTKYNKLNRNNIDVFYNEYSKGFGKGYNEFENSIKDSDSIFSTSNEQIAFKIYSHIKRGRFTSTFKEGDFKFVNNSISNKDIENKICLEYNIKIIYQITESNFFESGFNGGKFYKAWELILNNPIVFEPLFKTDEVKNNQTKQIEIDKENYKNKILFKIGLLFATGEMDKYFTVNAKNETLINKEYSAPKIAKELKNDSYNKYILATINNYTKDNPNGNKNIFNSIEMMTNIIDHCNKENLNVTPYFKSRLPIE